MSRRGHHALLVNILPSVALQLLTPLFDDSLAFIKRSLDELILQNGTSVMGWLQAKRTYIDLVINRETWKYFSTVVNRKQAILTGAIYISMASNTNTNFHGAAYNINRSAANNEHGTDVHVGI